MLARLYLVDIVSIPDTFTRACCVKMDRLTEGWINYSYPCRCSHLTTYLILSPERNCLYSMYKTALL